MNLLTTRVATTWIACIVVTFYAQVRHWLTKSIGMHAMFFLWVKQICYSQRVITERRVGRGRSWVFVFEIILDRVWFGVDSTAPTHHNHAAAGAARSICASAQRHHQHCGIKNNTRVRCRRCTVELAQCVIKASFLS